MHTSIFINIQTKETGYHHAIYSKSHVPLLTLPPLYTVFHLTVQYHIYYFIHLLDAGYEGPLFEVLEIEPRALYALDKRELFQICHSLDFWGSFWTYCVLLVHILETI